MAVLNIFRLAGDAVHVVSIVILLKKIHSTRSCSGISLKSQALYFLVYITRYLDLFSHPRADVLHIYNSIMKIVFVSTQAAILYFMTSRYRASYDPRTDSLRISLLLVPSAILAFVFMDGRTLARHGFMIRFKEYCWTFSIILEAVAILPQLFQLQKTGEAEAITTHYILCLGLYRFFYLLNWAYRWMVSEIPETLAVVAGCIQTVIYSDFFWIYYKRVVLGRSFKLPI